MSIRYTRKSLEALVNYANIVVPPCDGCKFKMYANAAGCDVYFTPVSGGSWLREIHYGRIPYGEDTPRGAAERFVYWLLTSSCPRDAAHDVCSFAYAQGIRL